MKFDNCLLASDFDGTFYADGGIIQKSVTDAIKYFIDNGGRFTISTGRVEQGFLKYDSAYINAPVLLANGAAAYDYENSRYVFLSGLGRETLTCIRAVMREYPSVSIEIYSLHNIYAVHISKCTVEHFTSQFFSFSEIDFPEQAQFPWSKVMLDTGDKSKDVQNFISSEFPEVNFLPTSGRFVEILAAGVNKGTGLYRLAEHLNIPRNRIFAVGDGYNDTDMLRAAKLGFAPSNSCREALECADYVVRSNNDGAVANVIEILDSVL